MKKRKDLLSAPAITFRLNPDLHARLLELAQRDDRKLANYVRVVVERHVREMRQEQPAAA